MKKLLLALAVAGALASPAFAGPCVALDYQEMKDMSADELVKASCAASETRRANMDDVLTNLRAGSGSKPFPTAHDNFDQCTGQLDRIARVLTTKGVTKDDQQKMCDRKVKPNKAAGT